MVYRRKSQKYKTTKKGGLKKRWYFSAGAKLPIVGQTNISFGSGSLNKRSFTGKVKATELRLAETKRKLVQQASISAGTQNTLYTFNPLGNIAQGSGVFNRVGDKIYVKGIDLRLHFYGKNQNDTRFRFLIIKHDDEYLGGSDSWGSGFGSTDIFYNYQDALLAQSDPRKVQILHDEIITLPRQSAYDGNLQMTSVLKDMYVNVSQQQQYVTGTNFTKSKNLYFVCIPHREEGISGTTAVGSLEMSMTLTFKDM